MCHDLKLLRSVATRQFQISSFGDGNVTNKILVKKVSTILDNFSFVIGRKNWLFSNTPQGADSSARIYSIIETAKMNNLNVYSYLVWMFKNIHTLKPEQLLPWSSEIPNEIKKTEDAE